MCYYKTLLFFVFVANFASANGQCADSFTNTKCIRIYDCNPLRDLVTKPGKTSEEFNYLRKRTCGYDGMTPKICCPNYKIDCETPNGVKGQCVDILNCSYIISILMDNPSPQDTTFVTKSRCNGPASYSVCCTPTPPPVNIQPTTKKPMDLVSEECPATALPPSSESGCCGQTEGFNKITGGAVAHIDQFTWLALIEYRQHNTNMIITACGGALISGKYVLTAAHCVDLRGSVRYSLAGVRLGEYDTENSGPDCVDVEGGGRDCNYGAVSIPVAQIIKHPDYQNGGPDTWNDIALLRLERMATFNYFVRPICLPSNNLSASSSTDLRLIVSGWGAVNATINASPVKQVVDLPYVDIKTCYDHFSKFPYQPRLWGGQICAGGEPGKDSCKGDSGGPLMVLNKERYEMVGIVSYGSTPCGRLPGVYTNVFAYLDWIRSSMHE